MKAVSGYTLREKLHESSRSILYRAVRASDGMAVVIKTQAKDHPPSKELSRIQREYDILASLAIPGVVRAYGIERLKNRLVLQVEDIGARSLASYLAGRKLSVDAALSIALRIIEPLGAIHQRNLIHKDINPANIVLNPDTGQLQLIDFGLATLLSRETPIISSPNVMEGSLHYISPEQTGRMNRSVDYRTDYYSLGITLYEMLTGAPPYQSDDPVELVHRHIAAEPVAPSTLRPEIPQAVSDIVLKLLAKTAEARYQSAHGIKADLEACLERLRRGERLEGFAAGRKDAPEKFQSPQKLYGREREVELLLSTFERVASGKAELLLVAGYSGVGKSALVNEVHRPILARRGIFISGKFDQFKRDIPYASLIQAFQGLVRQLLTESEETLDTWRRKLVAVVGANGGVITEVIPEVEFIIGPQPAPQPLAPAESQNRFNLVFSDFVRAFAAAQHPLVIFLDDLQWADAPSLKLIELLASSPGWQHLLVIGAYRDNEVTGVHPLVLTVEALNKAGAKVTTLLLTPLAQHHVDEYVADALRCPPERATSLSRLCFEKTHGNPFFLSQFLHSLHDERLVSLDREKGEWRWDAEKIRQRGITDNVVELLSAKLEKLPQETQRVLKLAACIGNQFELETLSVAAGCSKQESASGLWQALVEGFVLPLQESYQPAQPRHDVPELLEELSDARYRFQHDRVQQAAYVLIPEAERNALHLAIGRRMLASTSGSKREEQLFDIVNQLDVGVEGIDTGEERVEVAHLNLLAGRKAKASAAYEPALRYLETGLRLLPEGSWTARHELTFELHAAAIEAAYLNARHERARELAETAMAQASTTLEQVKLLETKMLFHTARNEIHDTLSTAHQALALLGEPLPPIASVDMPRVLEAIAESKRLVGDRQLKSLLDLPQMTDPQKLAAMRIMMTAAAPTYIASPPSLLVLVCAQVNLCLKYGNSKYSGYAYANYGHVQPDAKSRNECADLAEAMLERFRDSDRAKVLTLAAINLRHWMMPVRKGLPMLTDAVQSALSAGDMEYFGYASMHYCKDLLFAGETLATVERETARYGELLTRFKQDFMRLYTSITRQAALNLMGAAADPLRLRGESFDEDTQLPVLIAAQNIPSLHLFWMNKAMLAYLFGDYEAALAAAVQAQKNAGGHQSMNPLATQNFYHSLALLALAGSAGDAERMEMLTQVEKNQAELGKWAEDGPANYRHKFLLVEAERARVLGRVEQAMNAYEEAIREAALHQYVQEEALACERYAEFHLAANRPRAAEINLVDARHGYQRWGATAKVAQLEKRHPALLLNATTARPLALFQPSTHGSSESSSSDLDLFTVVKSARAISGEIVLSDLIDTVMRNVVENAGAQRGVLLLDAGGKLTIEAEWVAGGAEVLHRRGTALVMGQRLSEAVVNYAARTGESVILSDAISSGQFAGDPYIVANKPRSVLAAPLINQGSRVALIYLENNLTAGAFTQDRLEVLEVLLAQAALSIRNARLYESLEASNRQLEESNVTLERKVEERTRELREKNVELARTLEDLHSTQRQLVIQEKLASLGALTAGIAHELKNPLNFVNNFAEASLGFADELVGTLRAQESRLDTQALKELTFLGSTLRENLAKIGEHGGRADSIINSMLLHARQGTGERELADVNSLLMQSLDLTLHGLQGGAPTVPIEVQRDFDKDLGQTEIVVPDIARVFVNVLHNAWYAVRAKRQTSAPSYRPTISLRTRGQDDQVEVRIRDNGTGIPREVMEKIFNPFFTTKPAGEGTGLGLSLCHDIVVQRHRGQLLADSMPGEWSEFVIMLPRRSSVAAAGGKPAANSVR